MDKGCTVACYFLLVHAHLGQSGPDSLGFPDHDRELRVDSMVSHDAGLSIEGERGQLERVKEPSCMCEVRRKDSVKAAKEGVQGEEAAAIPKLACTWAASLGV